MALHPFDPVTAGEIKKTVDTLSAEFKGNTLRFKLVDVNEPIKKDVVPYLEAERLGHALPRPPPRIIQALFHKIDTGDFFKALVNADNAKIIHIQTLPKEVQGPVDIDEMLSVEQSCLKHPAVLAEIEKLELPPGYTVCTDPWIYGTDDANESRRLFQCYMYIMECDHPETNHYSLPCSFSPVFDALTGEMVRMDYLPQGIDTSAEPSALPWKKVKAVEYAADLHDMPMRTDLKPYVVQQPEGPSFETVGNLVTWQKWRFRIGFNSREGMVLYNVTYDGRNVFYRLALSEMTVPYGDPRRPYHRKQAFDVGDVGLGITANQLALGCDCLGHIRYFDGYRSDSKGNPLLLQNVICLHEQDGGLLYKHTNYRTAAATVVRSRELVVQMICTVSNYEYIFAWKFDQAAGLEYEVRATGILSTVPTDNVKVPWGTNVGPGVMAANHQHLFSLRIDPAIDGYKNTILYEDSVALPIDPIHNPYGVGYAAQETVIKHAGTAKTNVATSRVFKIRNDDVINQTSQRPVAYKIATVPSQMMIMSPDSFNSKRAAFASEPVWVTKYNDEELYAAGQFTNQSVRDTGLSSWASRDDAVVNEDVVFWHTFGLTHNPRPEDFPVMPVEKITVGFKPHGFFEKNCALDVPSSRQTVNQSVLIKEKKSEPAGACCNERLQSSSKL